MQGIEAVGMGTNAKLIIPSERAAWEGAGWNGDGTSDTVLGSTWQATMGQRAGGWPSRRWWAGPLARASAARTTVRPPRGRRTSAWRW